MGTVNIQISKKSFTIRENLLTSSNKLDLKDPTWDKELKFFNNLIKSKTRNSLKKDLFIQKN